MDADGVDPDYDYDISQESVAEAKRARQIEADARKAAAEKIRTIIQKQFTQEILNKEDELALITDRLTEARQLLDRLRACVVASFYASSFVKPLERNKCSELGAAQHPAIKNVLRKAITSVLSKNAPPDQVQIEPEQHFIDEESQSSHGQDDISIPSMAKKPMNESVRESDDAIVDEQILSPLANVLPSNTDTTTCTKDNLGGRHRIKKTVIVGNVSKYIPPDKREGIDKSTHKWMVYVRGDADEPRIDHFVRKVWFFLHPSYKPNDLVEVTEAPFHLTRRGWGEFPIRVQLHFCDPRNKRVDIIHNLRLDRTYTGLQTVGAETVCQLELDQSTIGLRVENLLQEPQDQSTTPLESHVDSETNVVTESCIDKHTTTPSQNEPVESNMETCVLKEEVMEEVTGRSFPKNASDSDEVENSEEVLNETPISENKRRESPGMSVSNDLSSVCSAKEDEQPELDKSTNCDKEVLMEVDEREVAVVNDPPSGVTEKRTRRRRGDSCTVVEADGSESVAEGPLTMKLVCSEIKSELDVMQESEQAVDFSNAGSNISEIEADTDTSVLAQTECRDENEADVGSDGKVPHSLHSAGDIKSSDENVSEELSAAVTLPSSSTSDANATSTDKDSTKKPVLTVINPPGIPFSVPASPVSPSKKCIILSATGDQSVSARLRSFSADGNFVASSSVHGKKIVYLKKPKSEFVQNAAVSSTFVSTTCSTSTIGSKVIVMRPRSASSAETLSLSSKSPANVKSSVTILKPFGMKNQVLSGGPIVLGCKRPGSIAPSGGSFVLGMPPEKRKKVTHVSYLNEGKITSLPVGSLQKPNTKIAVPISSLLKQTPISASKSVSPTADSTENVSTFPSSETMSLSIPPKATTASSISSGTKDVYLYMGASGSSVIPTSQPTTAVRHSVNSEQTAGTTLESTHKSYVLKNTKQGLIVVNQSPQPTTVPMNETATVTSESKDKKGLSRQQMFSLMAIQSALLGAGVSINRPMQIKIEKSSGTQQPQASNEKTNSQQFVLTTVTNEQGKQQLALVSADRMKQAVKVNTSTKPSSMASVSKGDIPVSERNSEIKNEDDEPDLSWFRSKSSSQETIPFYQMVGNKILKRAGVDLIKDALPLAARLVPLVQRRRNLVNLPFCAETEAEFLEWNIGKQRAAEWQRASLIHRILKHVRDASSDVKLTVPSKRFIVRWCLMRGYSVFTDEYDCEEEMTNADKTSPPDLLDTTLSCYGNLALSNLSLDNSKSTMISDEDCGEVDIISVTPPTCSHSAGIKEELVDAADEERKCKFSIEPTKEMRAVEEMANQIGVKMKPVPITSDLEAPLCQVALVKSLELFIRELTRESLASSLIRRDGEAPIQRVLPQMINVEDVTRAIQTNDSFDVFTDKYMGVDALARPT